MKCLNEFLNRPKKKKQQTPPNVLTLQRKYIRQFPGIGNVALYYSNQLKKHITIPFADIQFSQMMDEGEDLLLKEDNEQILNQIVDSGKSMNVTFDDGTDMIVDTNTANNILSVYARANAGNKKRLSTMMNDSITSFQSLVKFSLENS